MSDPIRDLTREIGLLVQRLRGWSGSSWDVQVGVGDTRAQRTRRLLDELVALGQRAGSGAPVGVPAPLLAPHALPDQLAVLGDDLVAAIVAGGVTAPGAGAGGSSGGDVVAEAQAAVRQTRDDLDGAGFGFRPR